MVYENRIQDVLGVVHKIGNGSFTKSSVKALVSNAKFKDENLMGQTTLVCGNARLWIFFLDQTGIEYYFGEIIVISINSGFTINTNLKYTWVILYRSRSVLIVNPNWQSRSKLFSASSLASIFFKIGKKDIYSKLKRIHRGRGLMMHSYRENTDTIVCVFQ